MSYKPTLVQLKEMWGDEVPAINDLYQAINYAIKYDQLDVEEAERMTAVEAERWLEEHEG